MEHLSPTGTKHKSLWKALPTLRPPTEAVLPIRNFSGGWARSDADRATTFAAHLQNLFTPTKLLAHLRYRLQPQTVTTNTPQLCFVQTKYLT